MSYDEEDVPRYTERREAIKEEWKKLGMETRAQSPSELRRVYMTYTKWDLITFIMRAESDAIKATRQRLVAWAEAQSVREQNLVLPRASTKHPIGFSDPFNGWLGQFVKGQTLNARYVFMEGWKTHERVVAATSSPVNSLEATPKVVLDLVRERLKFEHGSIPNHHWADLEVDLSESEFAQYQFLYQALK
jgi:hypothetical protein